MEEGVNWTITFNNTRANRPNEKQLMIEIHRLGADYPVKSDQKAAIKVLRKLLKEEHENQEPLDRRSKGTEETEITRPTAENKRLNLYVETINRERRPPEVTYAIDLGRPTTLGQEETSKHAEADEGSPEDVIDLKGSQTEDDDTVSQKKVAAETTSNTVAQDLEERRANYAKLEVPALELDEVKIWRKGNRSIPQVIPTLSINQDMGPQ